MCYYIAQIEFARATEETDAETARVAVEAMAESYGIF
jgi:hypothetical protein